MFSGLYSIPRHAPFLPALARGLRQAVGGDPLALAGALVLVPNRRSVRVLREAFLDQAVVGTEGATVLPRMMSFGDLGMEDTGLALGSLTETVLLPPVTGHERLVHMARFVHQQDPSLNAVQALAMAQDLGVLFNELARYDTDTNNFETLIGRDLAEHWEHTSRFISIITHLWPDYLRAISRSDPALYQAQLIKQLAADWQQKPPQMPIIMAGMARAEPVLVSLAKSILNCPQGAVVLPGFDTDLSEDIWRDLDGQLSDPDKKASKVHPDLLLRDVLESLGRTRAQTQAWPSAPAPTNTQQARADWVNMAMMPAAYTARWMGQGPKVIAPACLNGVTQITADDEAHEATIIALIIRSQLETPDQTISLLTADRTLARRVAALLQRWGIVADDSSGLPFNVSRLALFLQAVAEAAHADADSPRLLALLKHPLCALTADVSAIERHALRGKYPAPGFAGLITHLKNNGHVAAAEKLDEAMGGFALLLARPQADAAALLRAHIAAAEKLAGADALWYGAEGEVASAALSTMLDGMPGSTQLTGDDYLPWLMQLLSTLSVRVPYGQHPRVTIHGLIEARLQQADVMIVAGLNEGVWPALPAANPWLNRQMRAHLGLPSPDEVIAQQAHDFVSALSAPTVYMTRAARHNGAPTVPARWWYRLQAVLVPQGLDKVLVNSGQFWQSLAHDFDAPAKVQPVTPPAPCPPVTARPRQLSYSSIEQWMRNPYGLYAKKILGLRKLDPLGDLPDLAERGSFMHDVLADFTLQTKGRDLVATDWPLLLACGQKALKSYAHLPGVQAFWAPWFTDMAAWWWQEMQYRTGRHAVVCEDKGQYEWRDWQGGPFTLEAKADRIDKMGAGAVVVDYKTGTPPKKSDVEMGLAPQLNLEALLVARGGYSALAATPTVTAEYWHLAGTFAKSQIHERPVDLAVTEDGLRRLVEAFSDPTVPYHATPIASRAPRYNDYDHLARTAEWATLDGEDAA